MKLKLKHYNPNKKFIDTYGSKWGGRTDSIYNNGDCVIRAFTKLTDLDYTTVASMTAIASGYRDVSRVTNGNFIWDVYRDYLKDMGIIKLNFSGGKNLRNTVKDALNGDLDYDIYDSSLDPVSSLKDRKVTWMVTHHAVTTKGNTLYDTWDSSGRKTRGTAYAYSDKALNNSFDWS